MNLTCEAGETGEFKILGGADLAGNPPNFWEHSVYADPIPIPAPKATDAQRVTGLPGMENKETNQCTIHFWNVRGSSNSLKSHVIGVTSEM